MKTFESQRFNFVIATLLRTGTAIFSRPVLLIYRDPMSRENTVRLIFFIITLVLVCSCKTIPVKREIKKVEDIKTISPNQTYLKAHMKDGRVYVFHSWYFDMNNDAVNGYGALLDINRVVIEKREKEKSNVENNLFRVPITEIALVETNEPGPSIVGGLAMVTGITALGSILCLTNPKACFGSCPTFYATDGDTIALQAEGFSSSIMPHLEKGDIDMLYSAVAAKEFELTLTNEAFETHSIRYADLLVFEKTMNERVFATSEGRFYKCINISKPQAKIDSPNDFVDKVSLVDGDEYFSLTDSSNLNSKEELEVEFIAKDTGNIGLVIGKRQTLLTTFLMYQGLAYMGKSASYWLAAFEEGKADAKENVFDLLGGIEIYMKDSTGSWNYKGYIHETGPIATDYNILPLSNVKKGSVKIKLILNKGHWRIDYLGLATILEEVSPTIVEPSRVEIVAGSEADPLDKLRDKNKYLVTYPGDIYKLIYELPDTNLEIFLNTKGYYLEWMRDSWIEEQNFRQLNIMINKPAVFLKRISKMYKDIEPYMEETFWKSRYVNQKNSSIN
jgi:hypothetical protein